MIAPHSSQVTEAEASRSLVALNRKPMRPTVDAYRQGDLDGLCGIYAIINAVHLLYPRLDADAARALFRKLAKTLSKTLTNPTGPVYDGIGRLVLEDLLITAREQMHHHHGVTIEVERLVLWRKHPTLLDLWEALRQRLDGQTVAILGLSGLKDHWTVAYTATETTIRLFDSGDRHTLARSRCTLQRTETRFRLQRKGVLLLKRTP